VTFVEGVLSRRSSDHREGWEEGRRRGIVGRSSSKLVGQDA
jgi:hypothetical protein